MTDLAAKIVLLVAVAFGLFIFGYRQGDSMATARCESARLAQAAEDAQRIQEAIKANEAIAAKQRADAQKIKRAYEDEIAFIRATTGGSQRLRVPESVCNSFAIGSKADSASNADVAGARVLPEAIDRNLRALMLEADTIVASCRALQQFIIANDLD